MSTDQQIRNACERFTADIAALGAKLRGGLERGDAGQAPKTVVVSVADERAVKAAYRQGFAAAAKALAAGA